MTYLCSNPWTSLFVWGNGDVTHCCYSNWGALGNVRRTSLEQIINGPSITALRNTMRRGDFVGAGCEHYCRVFRWNRFYGALPDPPSIPEGLGRIESFDTHASPSGPSILGIAIPWRCNLQCTHCPRPENSPGLPREDLDRIWPWLQHARTLRLMNGEPLLNPESLALLQRVSLLRDQPTVFLNTNGQIPLAECWDPLHGLNSLHLKFSLEGVGPDYTRVRRGASWQRFDANLADASQRFAQQRSMGKDWRLYLNYCVMRSNIMSIPQAVQYAVDRQMPLVLNAIHGMRHLHENFAVYRHATITREQADGLLATVKVLVRDGYPFEQELLGHLDYILRVARDDKLELPGPVLALLRHHAPNMTTDRLLTLFYKWTTDKRAFLLYVSRKARKRLHLLATTR